MSASAIPVQKRTGRPRSERTEKAILAATNQLLAESGLAAMTIEGVAERAGVGKASIYRRWPSRGALAFDATFDEYLAGQPTEDTGSLEGDLEATALDWIRAVNRSPWGRTLKELIAEVQSDPSLAGAWRERFVIPIRQQRRPIVERAIARGEIPKTSDPELIMDLLYGPLYHRYLNGHLPLDDAFARSVARMVAAAASDGAAV
ncbi:MAG: TetR/AcrR family transcriptional regulator [Candidatus Dormibacteraeota bacterium]|nr:TetR/AcrR family transcriptional regulator [Candidatus Dormibacteraeota bacterium]